MKKLDEIKIILKGLWDFRREIKINTILIYFIFVMMIPIIIYAIMFGFSGKLHSYLFNATYPQAFSYIIAGVVCLRILNIIDLDKSRFWSVIGFVSIGYGIMGLFQPFSIIIGYLESGFLNPLSNTIAHVSLGFIIIQIFAIFITYMIRIVAKSWYKRYDLKLFLCSISIYIIVTIIFLISDRKCNIGEVVFINLLFVLPISPFIVSIFFFRKVLRDGNLKPHRYVFIGLVILLSSFVLYAIQIKTGIFQYTWGGLITQSFNPWIILSCFCDCLTILSFGLFAIGALKAAKEKLLKENQNL